MRIARLALGPRRDGAPASPEDKGDRPDRRAIGRVLRGRARQGHRQAGGRVVHVGHRGRGAPCRGCRGVLLVDPTDRHAGGPSAREGSGRRLAGGGERRAGGRPAPALMRLGSRVVAEPGSQLRRAETGGAVESYEALLRAGWSLEHGPDLVIRLGATPTSRALNSWLAAASPPTFLIDPDHMWPDQDHLAHHVVACDPQALLEALPPANRAAWRDEWVSAGKKAGAAISATLISTPVHEGHVVRALASPLPESAPVVIRSKLAVPAARSFRP